MKKRILSLVLIALGCAVFSIPAAAQYGTVKGVCKDAQGNVIADADVVWQNQDNGRSYKLKTNSKGEFFSLGIDPGKYTITLTKGGKVLDQQRGYPVGLGDTEYNIDLKQIQQQNVQDTAKKEGISEEEVKRRQEEAAKAQQRNANINAVNGKLHDAIASMNAQPPDYDKAISLLTEAEQMAPNEDVVWSDLGAAYLDSAQGQTDPQEKAKRNNEAYDDFKKAIDLKTGSTAAQPAAGSPPATSAKPATPADNQHLAGYYANWGSAAARLGKNDEAAQSFQKAADLDPTKAANYYYNLGIVLHNSAKDADGKKAAAAAFDKAIAADPTKADAYYLKGTDLIALSTTDSNGKLVAPDGTAEAFQKYLELQPGGSHAEEAKQMLAALGSTVETGFGKKSSSKKK